MVNFQMIIFLFVLHFVADYVFQPRDMAKNKSSDSLVLFTHCSIYFFVFAMIGWWFAFTVATIHFLVDWGTSRMIKLAWADEEEYVTFFLMGTDQLIHAITLLMAYYYIGGASWF